MEVSFSKEDYVAILHSRFHNPNIKFQQAKFTSLTENLEGFMGEHNILSISYTLDNKSHSENFFVKSKPKSNEEQLKIATTILAFEKEIFYYQTLVRDFSKRGYNTSFAPKFVFAKNDEILVLEDLKSQGYTADDRTVLYDTDKVKSSLKALAYYHGASFIYEEHKSSELNEDFRLNQIYPNEFQEKFLLFDDPNSIGSMYFAESLNSLVNLIDLLPETDAWKFDYKERLRKIDFHEIFTHDLKARKASGHGDLWSNNMLFKEDNNEIHCCIFDYQVLRYYNPAFDVLYIIFANTRLNERNSNMNMFLEYYYLCLRQTLSAQNVSIDKVYPLNDYKRSIEYYKILTRFQAAGAHTLTFLDINKIKETLEETSLNNFLFSDRPKLVCEAYKCDKLFKEIMTENLYDLHTYLTE